MQTKVIVLLLVLTSCTYRPDPQRPQVLAGEDSLGRPLDRAVPLLLVQHRVPAAGVAIIEEGTVIFTAAYGWQGPDLPASQQTLFNVASLTKPIALETILRLAAAGRLSLDEPMWRYWIDPDVASDPRHRLRTPRIALSHQTGFPNWRDESNDGVLKFAFEPGTDFAYSGEGYNYVARFAEEKLGQSFESLTQEYVLDPIGMGNTSFSWRSWMEGRTAVPANDAGVYRQAEIPPTGQWNTANNAHTTIRDYALFVASVVRGEMLTEELAAGRLRLHRSTAERSPCRLEPQSLCPTAYGMALGWERFDFPSGPLIMHLGGNLRPDGGGESAVAYYYPQQRRGLVVLTSGRNGGAVFADIIDIVDPEWPLRPFFRAHM